jgi:hypothetical protein
MHLPPADKCTLNFLLSAWQDQTLGTIVTFRRGSSPTLSVVTSGCSRSSMWTISALIGRHWLKNLPLTRLNRLLSHTASEVADLLLAAFAIPFNINDQRE